MQKQNIELLTDLYRKFAQFIYAVRTKYFAMDIKYSMLMSVPLCMLSTKTSFRVPREMKCADCRLFIIWQT